MNKLSISSITYHFSNQLGFSLIEVLISILVLSFGIIGAVKMQLHSVQTSLQSNFYSTAMELASEMAEMMRSNNDQMRLPTANPFLNVNFQSGVTKPPSANACYAANCSPNQLAKANIAEWTNHVYTSLPHARAVICRDSSPWSNSTNSLTWSCSSSGDKASVVIKMGWSEANESAADPAPRLAVAVTTSY